MTYDPTQSAQQNEFTHVTTILKNTEALIVAGDFYIAAAVSDALAAAQAYVDMLGARDNEPNISVNMKSIGLNSYLYQLTTITARSDGRVNVLQPKQAVQAAGVMVGLPPT